MSKKLTQEYVEKEVRKRGYKLLNTYINAHTKLILQDEEEYLYMTTWSDFSRGKEPNKFHKNNPYTIQNIKLWMKTNAKGYELISTEFKSAGKDKLLFKCTCGHEFKMTWNSLQQGYRCSVCTGQQVTIENCIYTTDNWMVKYFKNKEDTYSYSSRSGVKVPVVCPHCGKEKEMIIANIHRYKGIGCTCGDSISYPNKFVYNVMVQLFGINNVFTEQSFDWSDNKRYDILVKTQNKDILIENHGEQHYKQTRRKGARTLEEEYQNDQYKKELALSNGIDYYIELDCRESNLEYIKNSILDSELSELVDLSNIDWLKCEEYALSNKVKQVCDYWREHNEVNNEELTTGYIGEVLNLNRSTIIDYLKKGTKLGWCDYDAKAEMIKSNSNNGKSNGKPVEIFKNGESLGVFSSCAELSKQSEKIFGIKLLCSAISAVCCGKQKHHKGYTFRYITKEEYKERTKIN